MDSSWSANWVCPGLLLGGWRAAACPELLRDAGIRRIVQLFADEQMPGGRRRHRGIRYLVVDAVDDPSWDWRPVAGEILAFVRDGLAAGEPVLLHCHMGISRSATMALLFLMVTRGLGLDAALRQLRARRAVVSPNSGFMSFLRAADQALALRRGRGSSQPFV